MSRVVGTEFIIEREPAESCELCGTVTELRPYGPNKERICRPSGAKDPETTAARMRERIAGCETGTANVPQADFAVGLGKPITSNQTGDLL
jgi:hypothetical protein